MNRKVLTVILSFACLVSCTREANDVSGASSGKIEALLLELSQPSKTDVSYDADEKIVKSRWKADDEVLVTDLTSSALFQADESTHDTETGTFHGSLTVSEGASSILAVYPYSAASLSGGAVNLSLPTSQDEGSEGIYDIKAVRVPVSSGVSAIETTPAAMSNLATILRLKVTLPEMLAGISLSGEKLLSLKLNADIPITGSGTLDNSSSTLKVSGFSDKYLKYNFASEKDAAATNEALLFLHPADFSGGASIKWTAETTNYLIVWKLTPGMALSPGYFYNAIFDLGKPAWNHNSNGAEAERDFIITDKNKPYVDRTASSPRTVSFHWVLPSSFTLGRCKFKLYDASLSLLKEYDYSEFGTNAYSPCAFTFSGLEPETDYYVSVQGYSMRNPTEWSPLVKIHTAPALAEEHTTLALQGFDLCPWGGDYVNLAAGVKPSAGTASSLSEGWNSCPTSSNVTLGANNSPRWNDTAGSLSDNYSSMLSELGLEGWTFSNVYMRPGYAQVGSSSSGWLKTPALTGLSSGLHTVNIAFEAVPYTASGSKSGSVTVTCKSSGGSIVGTQTVNLAATPSIPANLPEWESFSLSFDNVPSGSTVTFSNGGTSNDFCIDEIVVSSDDALVPISHDPGNNVYGLITDTSGNPLSGVVVSDGYVVTTTAADGVYQFNSAKANGYVFISQPQGYEVALDGVFPQFWQALDGSTSVEERHDFSLTPVNNSDCVILALGDFHLCNRNALYDLRQFRMEVGELKSTIASLQAQGKKVYGLTLGDMTWDIYWDTSSGYSNGFDLQDYRTEVNNDFVGTTFPIWHTIGNHDHAYASTGDWDTVIPYKQILGPTYYSFNAGGYHIISLDNVICANDGTSDGRDDNAGLTSDILSWLQADIAQVPSGMPVIVSMHEQAYSPTNPTGGYNSESYASSLESALSGRNIHIVTGHTHNINNVRKSSSIYEHNAGALCATWWWTGRFCITNEATWGGGTSLADTYHIGRDGAPAGYTVYNLSNGSMTWKYKAFGLNENRQFKTYDRNKFALTAATWCPNASSSYQTAFEKLAAKGDGTYSYKTSSSSNYVYINVWNWDPDWTITVREGSTNLTVTKLTGAYDPMHMVAYPATRYNSGNNTTSTFVTCKTQHLFRVTASSATSTLTITVTDRFGNTYTETMTRPKTFAVNWD